MKAQAPDPIPTLFARHRLRCTSQRVALFTALSHCTDHPTAHRLHCQVKGAHPGLSLATVYNSLEAFCRVGLAQKLSRTDGSVRYCAFSEDHVHTHCRASGAIHDVPDDLGQKLLGNIPPRVIRDIEKRMQFKIDQVKIALVGQHSAGA